MKGLAFYSSVFFPFMILSFSSCNNDDNGIELSHAYTGVLKVEYTKGFPAYTATAMLDVDIQKDGTVTFSGGGDSDDIDAEDILYEDGKPVTKIKMFGTLVFHGAQGEIMIDGDNEYAMVKVNSTLYIQMTVWAWDDELGWIQVLDLPHNQEDKYSDGAMQFSILNAGSQNGEDIKRTLPDLQGTFSYGYNLTLIVVPG